MRTSDGKLTEEMTFELSLDAGYCLQRKRRDRKILKKEHSYIKKLFENNAL